MARPKSNLPTYLVEITKNEIKLWIRKCPKCDSNIEHKNYVSAKNCHKQKRLCYECGSWNKGLTKNTNESIKKMSEKVSYSMKELRKTLSPWNTGLSKENNEILKWIGSCRKGKKHSEKTKQIIGEHSK